MLRTLILIGLIGLLNACSQEKEPDDSLSSPIVIEEPDASNNNPDCLLFTRPEEEENIIIEVLPVICQEELPDNEVHYTLGRGLRRFYFKFRLLRN